jgi:hypothetical protein
MKGEWVIPPNYSGISSFEDNGLARAQDKNGKWGLINMEGDWVISPDYSYINRFSKDLYSIVYNNNPLFYYINLNGDYRVPIGYYLDLETMK